jgi:hexokinase
MYSGGQRGKKQETFWLLTLVCIFRRFYLFYVAKHLTTGGTNLRVCLVTLHGEGKFELTQTKYRLTEEQKQSDGQKLFDFCAECLKIFIDTHFDDLDSANGQELPLGFTVSS